MDKNNNPKLHAFMAACGIGSRRKCEEYIDIGRVTVNGRLVLKQGLRVSPEDKITYNGKRIYSTSKKIYIAVNKPKNYLCSSFDPYNRPLLINLFKDIFPFRLHNVGRLDFLSTGLIFFTNDGEFTRTITHPGFRMEKEYVVETKKKIDIKNLESFKKGIYINNIKYKIKSYRLKNPVTVNLVFEEGKNREIRNFFIRFNNEPRRVHRIRIGNITLKKILPGQFRRLNDKEVNWFLKWSRK